MVNVHVPATAAAVPGLTSFWLAAASAIVGAFGGVCTTIASLTDDGLKVTYVIRGVTTTLPPAPVVRNLI
jgi:hypothetical protein